MSQARELSICAILATRNEAPYLRYLLPRLASDSIDTIIIDHASDDDTLALAQAYRDHPVIAIHHIPYHGYFSLRDQLQAKQAIIRDCSHDWIIHQDADEVLEHRVLGKSLRDAIQEAHTLGYNVLNFDELCFLPEPDQDCAGADYYRLMQRYYFFAPTMPRLMRAWASTLQCENVSAAGHQLNPSASLAVFPQSHTLRHYPVLSQGHAWRKYLTRAFRADELADAWHANRVNLSARQLVLPSQAPPFFSTKDENESKVLCRNLPVRQHYWHW